MTDLITDYLTVLKLAYIKQYINECIVNKKVNHYIGISKLKKHGIISVNVTNNNDLENSIQVIFRTIKKETFVYKYFKKEDRFVKIGGRKYVNNANGAV